jgi:hypothetical protein
MPPSGKYSSRIAPADAMVIDFGVKNRVVLLWKSLFGASVKKNTKRALYSAHRSDKLRRKVEHHNKNQRAPLTF